MDGFTRIFVTCLGHFLLLCPQMALANRGYLVVAPSKFRPNTEAVISVTILRPSEPMYVEAKLFSKTGNLISEAVHEIFGKGNINLKVPKHIHGRCTLKICGNCVSAREGGYKFYNSTIIMVEEKAASAFIQLDKPVYKPGQKVFINVITTGSDLRPVNEKMILYIVDPRGSKMIQWKHLKSFCCGLVNVSYAISDQPMLGQWTVFAKLDGQTYNKTFEIQKYVLPKFEVSIHPPAFIQDWTQCEAVYVRAKYTYGKPVNGLLSITTSVKGVDYYSGDTSLTLAKVIKIADGVTSFNVCISQMMTSASEHFRGVLNIEALVETQDGTKVKASDSTCPVNKHLVELEFTKDTRRHFKPGLLYKGKVNVFYPDGTPAENVTVRVRSDVSRTEFTLQEYVSERGLVHFEIPAIPTDAHSLWIDAKVIKIKGEPVSSHYLPVYLSISSWYSPSKCHVLVEGNKETYNVGDEARFRVHSTCQCNFTMYYEVMSRGNLVHSGIHFARLLKKREVEIEEEAEEIKFEEDGLPDDQADGVHRCSIFIKFPIVHQMAPFSRLLVYYVRGDGEGVADSAMFTVKPALTNWMTVELSKRETIPGDHLQVHVSTRPDSCVCIAAVDKSIQLLSPGYQLSTEEIFEELESYDVTVRNDDDQNGWMWSRPLRSRRSILWRTTPRSSHSKDAQYAFEECGLVVLTDTINLDFRQTSGAASGPVFQRPWRGYHQVAASTSSKRGLKHQYLARKRQRTFFPETWLWTCFNASTTSQDKNLRVEVPDSMTTWVVEGISLSHKYGLALAEPVQYLKTLKHFFIDFTLPYSIIRGEQVKIPLTIHNYLQHCLYVRLDLKLPDGVNIVTGKDSPDLSHMCIGMEETRTVSALIVFTNLGLQNISAQIEGYVDSRCCSGIPKKEKPISHDMLGFDDVKRAILVEAEGLSREYTHSVFFCPNERIYLSTPNKYEFQYLKKPTAMTGFDFEAKARNDVRVALSTQPHDNPDMYVIVLGGWSNTHSWIELGKDGEQLANMSSPNIVSESRLTPFRISWRNGFIKFRKLPRVTDSKKIYSTSFPGDIPSYRVWLKSVLLLSSYGSDKLGVRKGEEKNKETNKANSKTSPDVSNLVAVNMALGKLVSLYHLRQQVGSPSYNDTLLMSYHTNRPLVVTYIGFSTGWGSAGEFKVWKRTDADGAEYGEVFHLGFPNSAIPGSERATATVIGDVMGPTLHNLEKLLKLPYGCGEQNMIHFAPNIYVMRYLHLTNQLTPELKLKGIEFLVQGYQRQLTYKREDGSYSAFGDKDASGNMWLTAFVLKCFAQAKPYIYIDDNEIQDSLKWIIHNQRKDGSFPPKGRLLNKEIQGGAQGKISLTSYVLIALMEVGGKSKLEQSAGKGAKKFLENHAHLISDAYTAAITSYALNLLQSQHTNIPLKILNEMAIRKDGLVYWKFVGQLIQDQVVFFDGEVPLTKVSSAEIEIASYALLTMSSQGDVATSLPVVKWLSQQRNPLGGFSSTQDTCIALQALSEYATLSYTGQVQLEVTLASTNMDLQETFFLNENTSEIVQTTKIPSLPTGLFVSASGNGCALLQIAVNYNVPDPNNSPSFSLHVRLGKQRRRKNRTKRSKTETDEGKTTLEETSQTEPKDLERRRRSIMSQAEMSNTIPKGEFKVTMEICTKWLHQGSSNMAVLDVSLLTGFKPDIDSLERLLKHRHLKLKRYEIDGRKVLFYFNEIRSGCLTCVTFEATREYVVGKTHPVPVIVYDYYEPGYEASTLYNVSHVGELIQDLCEDEACNEIKEEVDLPEPTEDCNSIFGCYEPAPKEMELCTCYRDCHRTGPKVCGSDGSYYHNKCRMEVEACQRDIHLEIMPKEHCEPGPYVDSDERLEAPVTNAPNPTTHILRLTSPKHILRLTSPEQQFVDTKDVISATNITSVSTENRTNYVIESNVTQIPDQDLDLNMSNFTNEDVGVEITALSQNTSVDNNSTTVLLNTTARDNYNDTDWDLLTTEPTLIEEQHTANTSDTPNTVIDSLMGENSTRVDDVEQASIMRNNTEYDKSANDTIATGNNVKLNESESYTNQTDINNNKILEEESFSEKFNTTVLQENITGETDVSKTDSSPVNQNITDVNFNFTVMRISANGSVNTTEEEQQWQRIDDGYNETVTGYLVENETLEMLHFTETLEKNVATININNSKLINDSDTETDLIDAEVSKSEMSTSGLLKKAGDDTGQNRVRERQGPARILPPESVNKQNGYEPTTEQTSTQDDGLLKPELDIREAPRESKVDEKPLLSDNPPA